MNGALSTVDVHVTVNGSDRSAVVDVEEEFGQTELSPGLVAGSRRTSLDGQAQHFPHLIRLRNVAAALKPRREIGWD